MKRAFIHALALITIRHFRDREFINPLPQSIMEILYVVYVI